MFTNNIRKIRQFKIQFLMIGFIVSLCFLLVIGKISAQELPEPPIDENEVEDINVLAGALFPGDANVLIYFDMSQSMGTHFGGAQVGNWDNTSTITTCELAQNVDTDYSKAHCIANAAGINTFLVNKDGTLIHSAFDITTIPTSFFNPDSTIVRTTFDRSEGIFGGCGAIACRRSKFGNCSDTVDFERFLDCIDFLYDDTVVSSVFSNAVEINCGPPTAAGSGNITTDKAAIINFCVTEESRAGAANAIDNFASFLAATNAGNTDLMTCGAKHCVSNRDVKFPLLVSDHSCNDDTLLDIPDTSKPNDTLEKDEYQLFKACIGGTSFTDSGSGKITGTGIVENGGPYKQPTVEACTLNTTNAPFCSPADNGSTRADGLIASVMLLLDADRSVSTTTCEDTDKLFNGVDNEISCLNYLLTPFRDLGNIPVASGNNSSVPVVADSNFKITDFLTEADADLSPFRINTATISGVSTGGGVDACTANAVFTGDQGGGAGKSEQKFRQALDIIASKSPQGRTALANAIGLDDSNVSGFSDNNLINDDILGLYSVTLQTDELASCRGHIAIVITDGEDNCSGDCITNAAFGTNDVCDDTLPAETGNSNRRSTLQAASFARTHFARKLVGNPVDGLDVNTEITIFYIGIGLKESPEAVRTLNTAALLGGTHTRGILRHRNPKGFLTGTIPLDGLTGIMPDKDDVAADAPWIIHVAEMETPGVGDFSTNPDYFTVSGCTEPDETFGECTVAGEGVFDNNFFDTSIPASAQFLDSTAFGDSFAFFVEDPQQLLRALEQIFEFAKGVTASGSAPTAPPTVTAVALRDRILLPNFTPVLADPLWQGRLALFGFLDDPDNPGAKFITRKPLDSGDFVKTVDGVDIADAGEILSASIFTDTGALNSNAEAFFWDAGKLLAERDIINFPRNLITVDSTVFESFSDSLIYTTALIPFNTDLDPEVFGISDTDVDPGGVGSIIPICTDVCSEDPFVGVCADSTDPDCLACVKEDCLRDKIVDFMSGRTGLLPVVDNFGEPTTAVCSSDIENNITEGIIGCGCPDIEESSILHITDATVVASLRQQMIQCERRLGDIFHSGPKIVQAPSLLFFDVGFVNFASKFKERDAVIYVGANDGFLHAFDGGKLIDVSDTSLTDEEKTNPFTNLIQEDLPFINVGTGEEVFAFAPPTFLQDSIAPDGTDLLNPIDFDPSSPGELIDPGLVSSGPEPVPDFRFGDFKTLVTKALDPFTNSFQRSFFDGTPLVADVFLDGDRDQTNGIQDGFNLCSSDPGDSPDGEIDPCGKEWHTVLMSGFRNGGGGLTVLDVTNIDFDNKADSNSDGITDYKNLSDGPLYPQHLWTFFDRNMGNSWSQPKIGRVRVQYSGTDGVFDRWLLFVGGGLDPVFTDPVGDDDSDGTINAEEDSYRGNVFYAIDIATGKIVFKFDKNDDPNFICDVPADPNVIDINTDGFVDLVYIGDKCGRLWRFDVSEPIDAGVSASDAGIGSSLPSFSASGWSGLQVFCANDETTCLDSILGIPRKPQTGDTLYPIFFAPTSVIDNLGRRHVVFVTGDRAWPSNTSKTKIGKLYNFIDEYIPSSLRGSVLAIETFKTEDDIDGSGTDGATILLEGSGVDQFTASNISALDPAEPAPGEFVVQFPNGDPSAGLNVESGEKGIGTPAVINGVLIFTTFKPDSGDIDACTAGLGSGRIFALDYITGVAALFRIPGAQATIGTDQSIAGITGGEGLPLPAQISYSSKGTITMSLAFSGSGVAGGAQFLIWELPKLPASTQTLYWEEVI